MKWTVQHIVCHCRRFFAIYAMLLLVLLTSCPIKSSLKTFVGLPVNTEQSTAKGNFNFSAQTGEKCSETAISEGQFVHNNLAQANFILPVLLLAGSFLLFLTSRKVSKEHIHPRYCRSTKIYNVIPLFLAYRKLILHFS